MKLYLVHQHTENGYDTYDGAVIAAKSAEEAIKIADEKLMRNSGCWPDPEHVEVELIGTAVRGNVAGIVLASFNAG